MALRRRIEDRMRRVLHTFNYREVQTPTFENLDLFLAKSGEGIVEEIYAFKDKGGRDLCLRPELTAPVMRFYFSDLKAEPKPLRLFYFGPCYRYDRPQTGRYREFWQLGTELIGDASPEAHAELLWLGIRLLEETGLRNYQLRLGHVGILRSLLESMLGVPRPDQAALMRLIDKKDLEGLQKQLPKGASPQVVQQFLDLFTFDRIEQLQALAGTGETQAAYEHLQRVLETLKHFGADLAKVRVDPTIARGLEYYSGLVFELDCPDLGAQKQLLGGGEYDLSGIFKGPATPTVGFGLGFDRTLVALEAARIEVAVNERVDALVAALSPGGIAAAQRLANGLRERDLCVDLELSARGPKRALQRATAVKARVAILVGDREVERGVAAVKDLDSGKQAESAWEDVPSQVEALLLRPG